MEAAAFGDADLAQLAAILRGNTALRSIRFLFNTAVTDAGVASSLAPALPHCGVESLHFDNSGVSEAKAAVLKTLCAPNKAKNVALWLVAAEHRLAFARVAMGHDKLDELPFVASLTPGSPARSVLLERALVDRLARGLPAAGVTERAIAQSAGPARVLDARAELRAWLARGADLGATFARLDVDGALLPVRTVPAMQPCAKLASI
jgi:hypothetical protein